MCIHTVCIHIEGSWTPCIQSIPSEPYLDLEKVQYVAVQYHVLVNACLVCGTYSSIYCNNLLNLTANEMATGLTSIHLLSTCSPDAYLDTSLRWSSNCIIGGKIQTIIMHSYFFDFFFFFFSPSALIPVVFGELGSAHIPESVVYR